jgi:hypothetical protein
MLLAVHTGAGWRNLKETDILEGLQHGRENTKTKLQGTKCEDVKWIYLA